MTAIRNPFDGRVHFSELKMMAKSPKHYAHACAEAKEVTRPMIVGALGDCIVFGNKGFAVYEGNGSKAVRNGEKWEQWSAAHRGLIQCIPSEFADAKGAAQAVKDDENAAQLLLGCDFQLPLTWEANGLDRASGIPGVRGGLDAINVKGCALSDFRPYIADLKITSDVEPSALSRHAWKMLWHVQGADFMQAAKALGMPAERYYIIAVEANAPHDVTILEVEAENLEYGDRSLAAWSERLRQCDKTGVYPGHTRRIEALERPEWEE